MNDAAKQCRCIVDTDGLCEIAQASGNVKAVLLDLLKIGVIGVPTFVWHEFRDLYEEEANQLKPYITNNIKKNRVHDSRAARIAEQMNSGFPRGSHDEFVEIYTAAVAIGGSYCILTSAKQAQEYHKIQCSASDIETFVEEYEQTINNSDLGSSKISGGGNQPELDQ